MALEKSNEARIWPLSPVENGQAAWFIHAISKVQIVQLSIQTNGIDRLLDEQAIAVFSYLFSIQYWNKSLLQM